MSNFSLPVLIDEMRNALKSLCAFPHRLRLALWLKCFQSFDAALISSQSLVPDFESLLIYFQG